MFGASSTILVDDFCDGGDGIEPLRQGIFVGGLTTALGHRLGIGLGPDWGSGFDSGLVSRRDPGALSEGLMGGTFIVQLNSAGV